MTEAADMARGLTEAQRRVMIKWPDAWMAASEVLGLRIAGNTAPLVARKGLLERRSDPKVWGRGQYRLTPLGLAVRTILQEQGNG